MLVIRIYRRDSPPGNLMINSSKYKLIYGGLTKFSDPISFILRELSGKVDLKGFYQKKLLYGDIVEIISPRDRSGFYLLNKRGIMCVDNFNPKDIINVDRSDMIYVMVCEPMRFPYYVLIQNKLEAMQNIVGGLIEPIYFEEDNSAIAWCNEEFLLNDSEPNRPIGGIVVHGTMFISGNDKDECVETSLTREQRKRYIKEFRGYYVRRKTDDE